MRCRFLAAVCIALISSAAFAGDMGKLSFEQLSGEKREQTTKASLKSLRGHKSLLVFWRSDCLPCQHEIRILPYLADTYSQLPITLIALQDAQQARPHLADMPELVQVWVAKDDGAKVLAAFGDKKKALPFSVILDEKGRVCYSHYGLVGTQAIDDGSKKCK